jgi:hypothetical protein
MDRNLRLGVRVPAGQHRLVPFSRFFGPVFFPDLRIPGQNPSFPPPRAVELLEFLWFNTLPLFFYYLPIHKHSPPPLCPFPGQLAPELAK